MPGLQDLTDEELDRLLAEQSAPVSVGAIPGQVSYAPPETSYRVPAPSPADLSDEELDARLAKVKPHQEFIRNALDGSGATPEQNDFYKSFVTSGPYDPDAEWGSENRPLLGVEGGAPEPGQWYVSLDGRKLQANPDLQSDQGLGFLSGALQPFNKAAELLESGAKHIPGYDAFNQGMHDTFGTALTLDDAKKVQQGYFDRKAEEGRIPGAVGRFGGQVVGTLPLLAAAPEGLAGAALTGAGSGYLLSDAKTAGGTAMDMIGGALGGSALHGLGSFIKTPPILNEAKQALHSMGAKLTPGQVFGFPEELVSKFIPFAGGARRESLESFTPAAGNVVLDAIGGRLPKGADPLDFIPKAINSAASSAAKSGDRSALTAAKEAADRFVPYRDALAIDKLTPAGLKAQADKVGNPAMAQFARFGDDIIGNTVPAGKGGFGLGAIVGDGLAGQVLDSATGSMAARIPMLAAAGDVAKIGAGAYSPPGRAAIRGVMLGERPKAVQSAAEIIRGKLGGLFGGQAANADNLFAKQYANPYFQWDEEDDQ